MSCINSTSRIAALVAISVLPLFVASARAQIVNGDFETPTVATGAFTQFIGGSNMGGWTVLGRDVILVETTYSEVSNGINSFSAQSGKQALDITGSGNTGATDGIQQAITTTPGQTYQLSFYVGRASGNSLYATPSTVNLSINGGAVTSFTNASSTAGTVNWQQFFAPFTANGTSTTIAFLNGTSTVANGGNNYAGLDNVSITAVPEAGTFALALAPALGVFGVVIARRRKSAAA